MNSAGERQQVAVEWKRETLIIRTPVSTRAFGLDKNNGDLCVKYGNFHRV